MSQDVPMKVHLEGIYSDPIVVEREGTRAVGLVVSIDGRHAVLTMPEHVARDLGHALQAGHLPELADTRRRSPTNARHHV